MTCNDFYYTSFGHWKKPIYSSVQFSHSVVSSSLWTHGLQHARLPCPSPTPGAYSNSCPSSPWCYPTISSSVVSFSSCLQSFPAPGSFQVSQFLASGGQSIGVSASASVLTMNIQTWFPLGLTGLISLQSEGLSRVFSRTTVWNYQFFGAQPSIWFNSHLYMTTEKTTGVVCHSLPQESFWPRDQTWIFCITGRFFTVWATRKVPNTGKTVALTRRTFVSKVISLILNILSRFVIAFLPRSKRLLISWL